MTRLPLMDATRDDFAHTTGLDLDDVVRDALLWREAAAPDGPNSPAESRRRTARGAIEDWLELR